MISKVKSLVRFLGAQESHSAMLSMLVALVRSARFVVLKLTLSTIVAMRFATPSFVGSMSRQPAFE